MRIQNCTKWIKLQNLNTEVLIISILEWYLSLNLDKLDKD